MPDDQIQTTIKDPKFLALSPDDQVAVLKHLKENSPTVAPVQAARPGGLTPPPMPGSNMFEGPDTKLARGGAMGVAQGLGIPTDTTDPGEVVTGAIKNAGAGYGSMAKSVASYALPPGNPLKDADAAAQAVAGPLGPSVLAVGKSIAGGVSDAWKGLKEADPEQFAQGFANAATQIISLAALRKGKLGESAIDPATRQAKLSSAIGSTAENHLNLEKSMSRIVDTAKSAGVNDVQDLGKVVKKAHDAVNKQFDAGFDPIKSQRVVPNAISKKILDLITPDMAQTAEGKLEIQKIKDAAVEYQKDWSLDELNQRRMNLDKKLASHYQKASVGQYADPVEMDIREAERQGAADLVYDKWGKANPGQDVKTLKRQHGALWQLDDAINGTKGAVNKLKAGQSDYKAEGGKIGALRGGISISGKAVPHGYLAGVADALFSGGPMDKANRMVRTTFTPSLTSRAARLGVLGFPAAHQLNPPPAPPSADEQ